MNESTTVRNDWRLNISGNLNLVCHFMVIDLTKRKFEFSIHFLSGRNFRHHSHGQPDGVRLHFCYFNLSCGVSSTIQTLILLYTLPMHMLWHVHINWEIQPEVTYGGNQPIHDHFNERFLWYREISLAAVYFLFTMAFSRKPVFFSYFITVEAKF